MKRELKMRQAETKQYIERDKRLKNLIFKVCPKSQNY